MGAFEEQAEGGATVSVEEGGAAVLQLPNIESQPAPLVTWQTDEGRVPYGPKYAEADGGRLVILAADATDRRKYRARALNAQSGREENSAYVRLDVVTSTSQQRDPTADDTTTPPRIVVPPSPANVTAGKQLHLLYCIANARPLHELETLWFKDGAPVHAAGVGFTHNDPWNRTLGLVAVAPNHQGLYECRVRLRSGVAPAVAATAEVRVHQRPHFTSTPPSEALGEFGAAVTLPCDASATPPPTITWMKDASALSTDERVSVRAEDNALVIRSLQPSDSGVYQCWVSNDAGEDSQATWLRVKSKSTSRRPRNARVAVVRAHPDAADRLLLRARAHPHPGPSSKTRRVD